jgi:hypothetical protein
MPAVFAAGLFCGGVWGAMGELAGDFSVNFGVNFGVNFAEAGGTFLEAFVKHFKYAALIWFASFAGFAGCICVFTVLFAKGIGLGFSAMTLFAAFGGKGLGEYFLILTFPQNIIVVCAYIYMAFGTADMIKRNNRRLAPDLMLSAGVGFAACLLAASFETYVTPVLFEKFVL